MKHFVMWLWSVQKENNSLHTRLSFLLVQLSSSQCWNPYQDGNIQFCLCQKTYPPRISEIYLPLCTPERYGLTYFFYCYEFLVKYLASIRNMSLVAHQFGRVEFRIFVLTFSAAPFWIKQCKNVQHSTFPNRWATKDIISLRNAGPNMESYGKFKWHMLKIYPGPW